MPNANGSKRRDRNVKRAGFTEKTHDALFRAAHDIKGEAATFGYPAIGIVAHCLCRLLEHTPDMTHIPLALVEQHVDAIRAIVARTRRVPISRIVVDALTRRLREVTDEFLRARTPTGRNTWKPFSRRRSRRATNGK